MQEFTEIEAKIPLLSLAEQISLRDQLDEQIENMVELSALHTERLQIEEMKQRLAGFLAGTIPAQPAEAALAELRSELGL